MIIFSSEEKSQKFMEQKEGQENQASQQQFEELYNRLLTRNRDNFRIICRFRKSCLRYQEAQETKLIKLPDLHTRSPNDSVVRRQPPRFLTKIVRQPLNRNISESCKSDSSLQTIPKLQARFQDQNMNPVIVNLNIHHNTQPCINRSEHFRQVRMEKLKKSRQMVQQYKFRREELQMVAERLKHYDNNIIMILSYALLPKIKIA